MISIVVPLYNEQDVVRESYNRLSRVMMSSKEDYELLFVNDGSYDKTHDIVCEIAKTDKHIRYISFSRNFGHQTAITAGMDYAKGDAVVVIDADLQDPPEVILEMIDKWKDGYEVVYGKRIKRKGETIFKKLTANIFYRVLRRLTDVDIPVDAGDFRLLDRKVVTAMKKINERNRYVRGLVSWVGFRQCAVEYIREERFAGETKYPLRKMLKFAGDGIISFSYKPLRIATIMGFTVSAGSFMYMIYVIVRKLMGCNDQPGWASLMAVSVLFNGITLIIMGIMGEYIGRIYDECKNRPLYIVSEKIGIDEVVTDSYESCDK